MNRRPLCVLALVVLFTIWILPAACWMNESGGGGRNLTVTGTIYKRETKPDRQLLYLKNSNIPNARNILVYLDIQTIYSIGNTISVYGQLNELQRPSNPGQFDARLYYQTLEIDYILYGERSALLDSKVNGPAEQLSKFRCSMEQNYERALCDRDSALLDAMILGDKSYLDRDTKDLYRKNGIAHLMAISGLHISIIGMSLYKLLRKGGFSFLTAGVPSVLSIIVYGTMTGLGTSTARAVVMFLLSVTADVIGRTYDMLSAMAVAALFLLVEQPLFSYSAGFLLSFGAILGLSLIYPALQILFPLKNSLWKGVLASLSIQIITFPIILYFYFEFPLYSVLINMIVIPLMTLVMISGIACGLTCFVSIPLGSGIGIICHGIFSTYEILGKFFLTLPGAVIISGCPKLWQIIVYYLGVVLLLIMIGRTEGSWKNRIRYMVSYAALTVLLLVRPHSGLQLTMLDVGQGDGLFLRTVSGTTYLFDGGSSSVSEVGTYCLQPFLQYSGVGKLDYVIVSHGDEDHISGIKELIEASTMVGNVEIGTMIMPRIKMKDASCEELALLAEKAGINIRYLEAGDVMRDGKTVLTCLHPVPEGEYDDRNEYSMVLSVEYQEFSALLMGDLEDAGEKRILQKKQLENKYDVLKVAHHGSEYSNSEIWLKEIQPQISLISCGANNRYGHPHKALLDRLEAVHGDTYLTTECGAITVYSDGKKLILQKMLPD